MQKERFNRLTRYELEDLLNIKGTYTQSAIARQIDRTNRDRPGGHDSSYNMVLSNTHGWDNPAKPVARKFLKRRVNKQLRQEHKKFAAEALNHYEKDCRDEWQEMLDFYEEEYGMYHQEYIDWYDSEMEEEQQPDWYDDYEYDYGYDDPYQNWDYGDDYFSDFCEANRKKDNIREALRLFRACEISVNDVLDVMEANK